MDQHKAASLLIDEMEATLSQLSSDTGLVDLIKQSLTGTDAADGKEQKKPWALLPLMVCEAISGHYEQALPAASAIQFFRAAGDVFDDIEDADSTGSLSAKYGQAVATNVATALVILGEKSLTRLKGRGVVEDRVVIKVIDVFNAYYLTACAGQHLDLSDALNLNISEDEYYRISFMKSATTAECACNLGAILAITDQKTIEMFSQFGYNLGMSAQIANDIQGATTGIDILQRKVTLPVIYALNQSDDDTRKILKNAFDKNSEITPDLPQLKNILFDSGAIYYATVKMEMYRQQGMEMLNEASKCGSNIDTVKMFLE